MFLAAVPPNDSEGMSAKITLPKEGLEVDPRVTGFDAMMEYDNCNGTYMWKFHCEIDGRVLTVTHVNPEDHPGFAGRCECGGSDNENGDGNENGNDNENENESARRSGWHFTLYFRIYDPEIETVPDFDSKSYTYHGHDHEHAPLDVVSVTIDPSVSIIKEYAFCNCRQMTQCIMKRDNHVTHIEEGAYDSCISLQRMRLSTSLRFIGRGAFYNCESLDALFFSRTLKEIEEGAFMKCTNMRILALPDGMDRNCVGPNITKGCTALQLPLGLHTQLKEVDTTDGQWAAGQEECCDQDRGRDTAYQRLLHLCTQANVTSSMMEDMVHIQMGGNHAAQHIYDDDHCGGNFNCCSLTPLHILCMNPYATLAAIVACYRAMVRHHPNEDPTILFVRDDRGMTPLDYLMQRDDRDLDTGTDTVTGTDDEQQRAAGLGLECIVHFIRDACIHHQ